jgi:hypothetical protein
MFVPWLIICLIAYFTGTEVRPLEWWLILVFFLQDAYDLAHSK